MDDEEESWTDVETRVSGEKRVQQVCGSSASVDVCQFDL